MKREMIDVLPNDLEDDVAIHVGVERVDYSTCTATTTTLQLVDPNGGGAFAIIKQGRHEVWIHASLWEKFITAASPIVERGAAFAKAEERAEWDRRMTECQGTDR